MHLVVGDHGDAVLQCVGKLVPRRLGGKLEKIEGQIGVARYEAAIAERDALRRCAHDDCGNLLALGNEIDRGLGEDRSGVAHGAAGMGAAADFHHIGIADNNAHALGRHVQQIRDHLRKTRLVPLPARLGADHHIDAAFRLHLDARLLARRADRRLHVVGKATAQQLAAALRFAAARRKTFPVGDVHRPVHILLIAAAVVEHADGIAIRHGFGRNEILAA